MCNICNFKIKRKWILITFPFERGVTCSLFQGLQKSDLPIFEFDRTKYAFPLKQFFGSGVHFCTGKFHKNYIFAFVIIRPLKCCTWLAKNLQKVEIALIRQVSLQLFAILKVCYYAPSCKGTDITDFLLSIWELNNERMYT